METGGKGPVAGNYERVVPQLKTSLVRLAREEDNIDTVEDRITVLDIKEVGTQGLKTLFEVRYMIGE